ncbi:hypothetical protein FNV43_RR20717 [Rhamnella rubrinervis]|uniref:Uncharacterized protein n=1 Tax=Rhamnella rubrinervis TaxID=2594499 RepID=A0A8K0DWG3_9ROSA|nr:hypothetical protein FNV43_RR20717 [Rhamnella rubrinervis]
MKIEILKSETIKPSSPTPASLRSFKLSVMDQLALPIYTPIVLFYPAAPAEVSEKLKKSLSETLNHFYPLAGRIRDSIISIECNDDGAVYVEARVHGVLLSDFLQQPDAAGLKQLLPIDYVDTVEAVTGLVLEVQANFFQCGGLAIGVRMSHTLADASTLSTFIRAWAATTRHDELTPSLLPHFETTAFRFSGGRDISVHKPWFPKPDEKVDRNEVTKRVEPPLPENSIRSYVFPSTIQSTIKTTSSDGDTDADNDSLKDLVGELRMGIKEFCESKAKKFGCGDPDYAFEVVCEDLKQIAEVHRRCKEIKLFNFISWCNFKFYEADFGWSKPSWVSTVVGIPNNFVRLMETRDGGGVEAWVTLTKQEMALFASHPQLLLFVSH